MADWEDHIVALERRAPADLRPHAGNWRKHPAAQRSTMAAAFDEVGKVAPLIENLRSVGKGWPEGSTPTLLDGHLRLELALEHGEDSLPVVVVDLTERQEALALATLDPIGAQAEADPELLAALLATAPPESPDLAALLKGVVCGDLADGDDVPEKPSGSSPWSRYKDAGEGVVCQIGALAFRIPNEQAAGMERWADTTDDWSDKIKEALREICRI